MTYTDRYGAGVLDNPRIDDIICLIYIIWIRSWTLAKKSTVCCLLRSKISATAYFYTESNRNTVLCCAHSISWEFSEFKHLYNKNMCLQ